MIYTLYSFKGGVGRSMALANVAECFFEKGLKVLMIDWDLEAPGLENYLYSGSTNTTSTDDLQSAKAAPGLLELLLAYQASYPEMARRGNTSVAADIQHGELELRRKQVAETAKVIEEAMQKLSDVPDELKRVASPMPSDPETRRPTTFQEILEQSLGSEPLKKYLQLVHKSGSGELWLMGAGVRSPENYANYANAVQDFDWIEFLAAFEGREFLEWLRVKLAAFDVVLIDSRTGVTEMGGICTRQLADVVVSFCAPNLQNVEGVARVRESFSTDAAKQARYGRNLEVLVIPTRIDVAESDRLNEFSKTFGARIEDQSVIPRPFQGLERPLWNLQVPYIPKYNYLERLVIGPTAQEPDPPTTKLIEAYRRIAVHMAVLAEEGSRIRQYFQSEISSMFSRGQAPRMAPTLPGTWIERAEPLARLKQALLDCSRAPNGGRLAVWGRAGMGKSTLVARACGDDEILKAFPDGIVWLTMDRPWPSDEVRDWLKMTFALPRGSSEVAVANALAERRFLFVVDDVWDLEQVDPISRYGRRCTRLVISRDLNVASKFAERLITAGPLNAEESAALLNVPIESSKIHADPILAKMIEWPLGASLLRSALEHRIAKGEKPEQAWIGIRDEIERRGITALDPSAATDRNSSVALSLRETVGRLTPKQRRLLFAIGAKGEQGEVAEPGETEYVRLQELGLVQERAGKIYGDERVYRWLLTGGELDQEAEKRRRSEREKDLEKGYAILHGARAPFEELERLAGRAKDVRAFSLARRLFGLARQHPEAATLPTARRLKLLQQHAFCTYKDEDVVIDERYSRAFEILKGGDLLTNPSQETLGLAGSIHKLRWRANGQRRDLELSLLYYGRGAEGEFTGDFGYTRINAAFVLDLLASRERPSSEEMAKERRERATRIREEIVAKLPELASQPKYAWLRNQWWFGATMAEACFGLRRYAETRYWLRESLVLDPPSWQLETTTRQLALLAKAQGVELSPDSAASRAMAILVNDASDALAAIAVGKLGLALSGGGFRASLFHIGVLARLAELDVLRHVEVLSCVSGGSIIGAHYYLEVRRLLQEKADGDVTREDYIDVVRRIERDFLAGVQLNLRTRLLAGWWANLRSIFKSGYTRTTYLGELLERHIYARVKDGEPPVRWLNELRIHPKDSGEDFNPKLDNWRRCCKVPILLLNATTLNTGHVWQFTVSWMGEPATSASSSVDGNDLLRRMYYYEAPAEHQKVRLGQAVAASACVPALFDPIELHRLYPMRTLRLVDGGVHDNQGVAGLLEQECTVTLVSDASGQMNSQRNPSGEIYAVPFRSNSILMARVREAEFQQLDILRNSSALSGSLFLHLKKDLEVSHVDWLQCQDPYDAFDDFGQSQRAAILTSYEIPKLVQSRLAGIRTDLDTFSDVEAYALMLSGYRMTSAGFAHGVPDLPTTNHPPEPWRFLAIAPAVDRKTDHEAEHDRLLRHLAVGANRNFRVWRLFPALWGVAVLVLAAMVWGVTKAVQAFQDSATDDIRSMVVGSVVLLLLLFFLGAVLLLLVRWRPGGSKTITTIATGLLMVTVGWIAARAQLWLFDRLYRKLGAVRQRDSKPEPEQHGDLSRA